MTRMPSNFMNEKRQRLVRQRHWREGGFEGIRYQG